MTLQEKLRARRRIAQNIKPVKTAEEIWKYILLEFESMTSIELRMGRIACVDIEKSDKRSLTLNQYILDADCGESNLQVARILLDEDCVNNFEDVMQEVAIKAQQEGCLVKSIKEKNYQTWAFAILLVPIRE